VIILWLVILLVAINDFFIVAYSIGRY
jgi:hypothetical protein